jgi:nitroreductase
MDALHAILNRTSAITLGAPAPTPEQLNVILDAAKAAPDHGRLQPWRFVVIEGEARNILGKTMADLRLASTPDATPEMLAKETGKAFRAPTIIAVAAAVTEEGKIPVIEQVMAVAAATQNMFLAAYALGLGAMWKTGGAAYDASLKTALGLAPADHIVAFLYLGTRTDSNAPVPKRPKDVVRRL